MEWIVITTIIIAALMALYILQASQGKRMERFADYYGGKSPDTGLDGVDVDLASFPQGQQALLANTMKTDVGLSKLTASSCAAQDRTRQMEVGGQYVQRTNNYRRDYPDNCSAPLTEFVDSVYVPRDGVGLTVPCDGTC